jgi:RNA polymerase sigma-70 factor, ECF subfamily
VPPPDATQDAPLEPTTLDAESCEWLRLLRAGGPEQDRAIERLHQLLVRIARSEANRRNSRMQLEGAELEDMAHQAAADALLAIMAKLDRFRGASRFTTWAYKFVVFEVSGKMSRHFWRKSTIPMDAEDWDRLPDRFGFDPAHELEWQELMAALRRGVDQELTERQRKVFVAIILDRVPLDAVAMELGSNRNAIYKTLFDARRKLRVFLDANGYLGSGA